MSELTERAVEVVMQHQRYSAARFILRDIVAILDGAGFLTEPDAEPRNAFAEPMITKARGRGPGR